MLNDVGAAFLMTLSFNVKNNVIKEKVKIRLRLVLIIVDYTECNCNELKLEFG